MFPGISSCDNFTARGLGVQGIDIGDDQLGINALPPGFTNRGDGTMNDGNGNVYNLATIGTFNAYSGNLPIIGTLNPNGGWTDLSGGAHGPTGTPTTATANSWVLPVVIGVAALWLLSRNK